MRNIIRVLCLFVLSFCSAAFSAEQCETPRAQIGGQYYYGEMAICNVTGGRYNPPVSVTRAEISGSQIICYGMSKQGDGTTIEVAQFYANFSIAPCPVCPAGQNFDKSAGKCVEDRSKQKACGADFTYAGWGVGFGKYTEPWAINGYVPSGEQCDAYTDANPGGTGCKVYFAATGTTKNDNGTTTTTGNFRPVPGDRAGEGVPCSPTYEGEGKDVVDNKPPEKCDGYEGTVGGEKRCIPNVQNNGVDWAKTEKSEKKSDGTTVDTKVEQRCEKDKCTTTTTTTTKDAAGNTTSTSTSETKQDVVLFCKENPDKCKNGKPVADKGSGGGSGGGTGSGTGGNGDGSGSCTGSDCPDNNAPGGPGKVGMPGSGAPEIGSFYEREYKQGPVQLWSEKTAQLKESGLGALASNLMPRVGDGGVAPTWIIDLDFGPLGNYGQRDISPPSWVWGVIRAITILSALIVARKLVFGG